MVQSVQRTARQASLELDGPHPKPKEKVAAKKNFLDLPAEVRNAIYELALDKQTIVFSKTGVARWPGLLMVCKQVHQDTEIMRYAECTLHFENVGKLASWLRNVDVRKRTVARRIIVDSVVEHRLWREDTTAGPIVHGNVIDRFRGVERRLRNAGIALRPEGLTLHATCWSKFEEEVPRMCLFFSCHRDIDGSERVQEM